MKATPPPPGPPMGNATPPPPPQGDAQWTVLTTLPLPLSLRRGRGVPRNDGWQRPSGSQQLQSCGEQNRPSRSTLGALPVSAARVPELSPGTHHSALLPQSAAIPAARTSTAQPFSRCHESSVWDPEALRVVNLLQERNLLPPGPLTPPTPCLTQDLQRVNCNPEVFRCTLTSIPQTQSLLNKAKLPLGLLLHPFKDLSQLPVVTSSTIVRCRSCRTYINPFVSFLDQRRWKCNLCYRVNEVPEEFMYNPVSRAYGEPHKRPEVQNATIEFIAPSEYMLRPPQPAVYLFVLDVSHNAVETGYLHVFCQSLLDNLNSLPGDTRTKVGFITFDSTIHFYNLQEGLSQPQMLIVSDLEDIFLPTPDSLLVNLNESKELVQDLLKSLPTLFEKTMETQSALGSALQAAFKLLSPTGGRMSVFQTQLPNLGAGALQSREDPNQRAAAKDVQHLSPATDFYKKLALDCSGQQVAVDLFLLSAQYCDLASLGCISRYSAGSVYYYPSYHQQHNAAQVERFQKDLKRYLTRKIGFEAVMRIRCTKGLSIHTFHGNFFVRSTDLLSLPNVNPDAGFAVQMSIDENLDDLQVVSFQAALLYTSSKGERRIRVHTLPYWTFGLYGRGPLCDGEPERRPGRFDERSHRLSVLLPTVCPDHPTARPAVARLLKTVPALRPRAAQTESLQSRDEHQAGRPRVCHVSAQVPAAGLRHVNDPPCALPSRRPDGRGCVEHKRPDDPSAQSPQLSVEKLSREGAFLMDAGRFNSKVFAPPHALSPSLDCGNLRATHCSVMYLWIGRNCNPAFLSQVLGVPSYAAVPENLYLLPELDTAESQRVRAFVGWLKDQRPFAPTLHIIRDESQLKTSFLQNMIEDRTESALSYYEFLLHLQQQISK
ncbi:hypothetical protein WMY93_007476 [Mugilogobius chulae]|uniref:Protein transport protein Sec24A n=1 Tax=Mugilogobius chulae TaxID=88201 RepID=A0AAW0PD54_9GOBI